MKNVHKQLGKRFDYREISDKFEVGSSTVCKKVRTAGTDENLFRLVPVFGHSARVPSASGASARIPGYGAQICDRAPTKGSDWCEYPGTKSGRGLRYPCREFN